MNLVVTDISSVGGLGVLAMLDGRAGMSGFVAMNSPVFT